MGRSENSRFVSIDGSVIYHVTGFVAVRRTARDDAMRVNVRDAEMMIAHGRVSVTVRIDVRNRSVREIDHVCAVIASVRGNAIADATTTLSDRVPSMNATDEKAIYHDDAAP